MIGLNPALKLSFYSNYSFEKAQEGPLGTPDVFTDGLSPKARGHDVDRQTELMVRLVRGGLALVDLNSSAEWRDNTTPMFRDQIVRHLEQEHLLPVASQMPVCRPDMRVGTSLDLVCRTTEQKFVVFELKVGYSSYHERCTGQRMGLPFYFLTNSPRQQHRLYLAFAVTMFPRPVDHAKCAVLRITPTGLHVDPLPQWATREATMKLGWEKLALQKNLNNQQRKRSLYNAKRRKMSQQ